jgi:hypothetical protein
MCEIGEAQDRGRSFDNDNDFIIIVSHCKCSNNITISDGTSNLLGLASVTSPMPSHIRQTLHAKIPPSYNIS